MEPSHKAGPGLTRRLFIRTSLAAAGLSLIKGTKLEARANPSPGATKIKEYRTLGRTGFKVSDIGFGAGNLTNANVLASALDAGINYIDTAEHYVHGNSERTIGQVLSGRDRKKIFLTTKLNLALGGSSKEKLKERFTKCLERMQTDYADCLMLHMTPTVDQIGSEGYHSAMVDLKAEGRVRFTGLSNHGTAHRMAGQTKDEMDTVILAAAEDGRFDVVLFTYNFIQKDMGDRILKACKAKDMGTTLMKTNPLKFYQDMEAIVENNKKRGRTVGEAFLKIMEDYKTLIDRGREFIDKYGLSSPEESRDAAIRFCIGNPEVHSVCPTLNSFDDLEAYTSLSGTRLDARGTALLSDYRAGLGRYYCRHACGLCEGSCPESVPVNTIMRYHHYYAGQGRQKQALGKYRSLAGPKAESCGRCPGPCEQACPYEVPIRSLLVMAHETLTL